MDIREMLNFKGREHMEPLPTVDEEKITHIKRIIEEAKIPLLTFSVDPSGKIATITCSYSIHVPIALDGPLEMVNGRQIKNLIIKQLKIDLEKLENKPAKRRF